MYPLQILDTNATGCSSRRTRSSVTRRGHAATTTCKTSRCASSYACKLCASGFSRSYPGRRFRTVLTRTRLHFRTVRCRDIRRSNYVIKLRIAEKLLCVGILPMNQSSPLTHDFRRVVTPYSPEGTQTKTAAVGDVNQAKHETPRSRISSFSTTLNYPNRTASNSAVPSSTLPFQDSKLNLDSEVPLASSFTRAGTRTSLTTLLAHRTTVDPPLTYRPQAHRPLDVRIARGRIAKTSVSTVPH
ncbi:hypothetical protein OF83DRAFT_931933 [Amylostereum chailletii]|nr:hypothetical protein OF83DRAFT_931933 [Amylostereum chailletii]